MGQGQSNEPPPPPRSHEQLVKELANRFAEKCFSAIELYSLKDNFKSLADRNADIRYLKEDTVARFLAIPDVLGASPVVYHMLSNLGAFPFLGDAPAVLGLEQLVIVVTLLTERYRRVLARGATDRRTLLFRSLAVHDRKLFAEKEQDQKGQDLPDPPDQRVSKVVGFAVDEAVEDGEDGEDGDDYDDELALAALEVLDYANPLPPTKKSPAAALRGARIPADNFRKLVMLLLLAAPLGPQEQLSQHAGRFAGDALEDLRATAECVLAAFLDVETSPGIKFAHFDAIVPVCFPFLFSGFGALLEHFLFSKSLDFSTARKAGEAPPAVPLPPPPLLSTADTILNLSLLSQLSFFLPGTSLFQRLRLLYSGADDGFSLGSFETKVVNWRAPTILLVQGTRIDDVPHGGPEAAFSAALPPRRFPHGSGSSGDDRLVFGVYVSQPWRLTNRECFGDSDCVLFQLAPVHDVFAASTLNRDYATFVKPSPANHHVGGLAFGCPSPSSTAVKAAEKQHQRRSSNAAGLLPLGPLALLIDSSLEFGVMYHDAGHGGRSGGGGAFRTSTARPFSFQDRFAIEALEVWGCGGDAEAKVQAERWAWEAREAEARRHINLGTGDIEADRALLEMAGLIGGNRSGGSMG